MAIGTKIKLLTLSAIFIGLIYFNLVIGIFFIMVTLVLAINTLSHVITVTENLEKAVAFTKDNKPNNFKGDLTEDQLGKATGELITFIINSEKTADESIDNDLDKDIIIITKYLENLSKGISNKNLSQTKIDDKLKAMVNYIDTTETQLDLLENNIYKIIDKSANLEKMLKEDSGLKGRYSNINSNMVSIGMELEVAVKSIQVVVSKIINGKLDERVTIGQNDNFKDFKDLINTLADNIEDIVNNISEDLTNISKGKVSLTSKGKYLGDFEKLNDSKNLVVSTVNLMVKNINETSERILQSGMMLNNTNVLLGEKVFKQSTESEGLSKIVLSVSDKTTKVVENINNAKILTNSSKEIAEDCKNKMLDMLQAMEAVENASRNVSNIIKVIEDIAFQTNILALNAAVEAARAGVHGKGFAVVAEEVRNLSMRSQKAVKESEGLITVTVGKVNESLSIAKIAASKLNEMADNVTESSNIIDNVDNESNEQKEIIGTVNNNIHQVSEELLNIKMSMDQNLHENENLINLLNEFKAVTDSFHLIKNKDLEQTNTYNEKRLKKETVKKLNESKVIKQEDIKADEVKEAKVDIKEKLKSTTKLKKNEKYSPKQVKEIDKIPVAKDLKKVDTNLINNKLTDLDTNNKVDKKGKKTKSSFPESEKIFKREDVSSVEPLGLTPDIVLKSAKEINLETDEEIEKIISTPNFGKY